MIENLFPGCGNFTKGGVLTPFPAALPVLCQYGVVGIGRGSLVLSPKRSVLGRHGVPGYGDFGD